MGLPRGRRRMRRNSRSRRTARPQSAAPARSQACAMALLTLLALAACDRNVSNDTPHPGQQPPTGWRIYGNAKLGFSIAYPAKWRLDRAHIYPTPVDDSRIAGTAFIVPRKLAIHSNLSTDSYLSVESVPSATACLANAFLAKIDTQAG